MFRKFVEPLNRVLGPPSKPSIEEAPKLELKSLPSHLRYAFLGANESLHVILYSALSEMQMFDRLAGQEYYCFLDGYSGYNQIVIASEDQEKTTFTFAYGTYAFKRMSFGLCNAPSTFQRCMMDIFHDMVEDFVEIFMDGFPAFEEQVLDTSASSKGINFKDEIPGEFATSPPHEHDPPLHQFFRRIKSKFHKASPRQLASRT
uniref:Reverse transcriptase domain-containing protein n=1 Tax=Solanum lycopersicum TaxID=4081 RepID=A0A3Q7I4W9_SOLLC